MDVMSNSELGREQVIIEHYHWFKLKPDVTGNNNRYLRQVLVNGTP